MILTTTSGPAEGASIRGDNLLQVGGQAFFPIGLVELGPNRYPTDWNDRIRQSGANAIWDTGRSYANEGSPSCQAIADSAEATGYKLVVGSPATWIWDNPNTPEPEVEQPLYDPQELQNLLDCMTPSDLLISLSNRDEPVWTIARNRIGDIDSAHIAETYVQLNTTYPEAPVSMNFAPVNLSEDPEIWKEDIRGYLHTTDIAMFASYPYPPGEGTCQPINVLGYPDCLLDRLPNSADAFRDEILRPDQPLWMVVQAFKGIPLKEGPMEAWASIIHGATGIFWAGWTWVHPQGNGADNWPVIQQVVSEVSSLHDWLVLPDHPDVSTSADFVDLRAKWGPDGSIAVFAVSRYGEEGYAWIRLPQGIEANWAEVLFEDRSAFIFGRFILDYFEPYEAHVYKFDGEGAEPPTSVASGLPSEVAGLTLRVFPNPTRQFARAFYEGPDASAGAFSIYDVSGRLVKSVQPSVESPTSGTLTWDGRDSRGSAVGPGIYFLRGSVPSGESATARIVLTR